MKIVARSSLDVAMWFTDRALGEGEYLQPQKLHRLMYLAQAYFTVAYPKQKLMPATFVIDDFGPVEPTVFHALAYGVPNTMETHTVPEVARDFLESIWRRFGAMKTDPLTKTILAHAPVADTIAKGSGQEIPFEAMVSFYGSAAGAKRGAPSIDKVMRPRVMRSQGGKPVSVTAWKPKSLPTKG